MVQSSIKSFIQMVRLLGIIQNFISKQKEFKVPSKVLFKWLDYWELSKTLFLNKKPSISKPVPLFTYCCCK